MTRHYADHRDQCHGDFRVLDGGCEDSFCLVHDLDSANVAEWDDGDYTGWLHQRGTCPACDRAWEDVDANLAYNEALAPHPHSCRCNNCQSDAQAEHHFAGMS